MRLLAIGNSFSWNATDYLLRFVEAQGHQITLGHASNGGWSLEKHWQHVELAEAGDPLGKPYNVDGQHASLKERLTFDRWDIVTLQQHSWSAKDLSTYQPFANQLADYVRRHAPQAALWVQETWAYRGDSPMLAKDNLTSDQMYQRLHHAYDLVAAQVKAAKVIPTGTAFQNARQDPRWQLDLESFDPEKLTYPNLPRQTHSLVAGWHWNEKQSPPTLAYDGKHCNPAGRYLGTVVWYHTLFGELRFDPFIPPELPAADAAVLLDIGRKTVMEGLKPATERAAAAR